jgi:hypothetical protein
MKIRAIFGVAAAIFVAILCADASELTRQISRTRQFHVYADDALLASAVGVYAEQLKSDFLARLNLADKWRDPIIIRIESRADNQPPLEIFAAKSPNANIYGLVCRVPPPIDEREFVGQLVKLLCLERANRDTKSEFRGELPLWLTEGLAAMLRADPERDLRFLQRSVAGGRPHTAADLLAAKQLPAQPADRTLFRVTSARFVEALLARPDGREKLTTTWGETEPFAADFGFVSDDAMEIWWQETLARRARGFVAERFLAEQTRKMLDEIRRVRVESPEDFEGTLADLWRHSQKKWLAALLTEKSLALQMLQTQAHPLYEKVLQQYAHAISLLQQRRVSRFRRQIRIAEAEREKLETQIIAVRDYLDGIERTQPAARPLADIFNRYFQTMRQFEQLEASRAAPIKDYLDRLEADLGK